MSAPASSRKCATAATPLGFQRYISALRQRGAHAVHIQLLRGLLQRMVDVKLLGSIHRLAESKLTSPMRFVCTGSLDRLDAAIARVSHEREWWSS